MSFTGNEDHSITLDDASEMTKNYRDANPDDIKGHFFGKAAIQAILDQDQCVGIRIYYGISTGSTTNPPQKQLIVVGVLENQDDLYNGSIADKSMICPPACSTGNPLNQ